MKRIAIALVLVALGGWAGWHYFAKPGRILSRAIQYFRGPALPTAFASGNGRIEATEYDVSTKRATRIIKVLVKEGDLAFAPGKLQELVRKMLRKAQRFGFYAGRAAVDPAASPVIEPLPQDHRFTDADWQRWRRSPRLSRVERSTRRATASAALCFQYPLQPWPETGMTASRV